jgi:hypothetical protein
VCGGGTDSSIEGNGRVASALLFCKAADAGGYFRFPKSDVVLKPKAGMAVVFSYKSAEHEHLVDVGGYTEYSMCPVLAGEQVVAELHMRQRRAEAKSIPAAGASASASVTAATATTTTTAARGAVGSA